MKKLYKSLKHHWKIKKIPLCWAFRLFGKQVPKSLRGIIGTDFEDFELKSTIDDHNHDVQAVYISGDILASGSSDNEVMIHDISDPESPSLEATITAPTHTVHSVHILDDLLAVGSVESAIRIYDISTPSSPSLQSTIDVDSGWVFSVHMLGDLVACGTSSAEIKIYDISDATDPSLEATITNHSDRVYAVHMLGDLLASGSADNDVRIYDISNPSSPVSRARITHPTDDVMSVHMSGDLLVVGSADNAIRIYDISTPTSPILKDTITDHSDTVRSVYILGDLLVSGSDDNDIRIYDISDPESPLLKQTIEYHSGDVISVHMIEELLASGSADNDIRIYQQPTTELPTVTTQAVDEIQTNQADGNGNITDDGGEDCTERGFVYSETSRADPGNVSPAVSDYEDVENEAGEFGTGAFSLTMTGLDMNTTYYVRAYAKNSAGYSYGDEVSFKTLTDPIVSTKPATNLTQRSVTLNGELDEYGDLEEADNVFFRYRKGTEGAWIETDKQPVSEAGTFDQDLDNLDSNSLYQFKAVVEWEDEGTQESEGEIETFTTYAIGGICTLSGSPVSGAKLYLINDTDGTLEEETTSGADGRYHFETYDDAKTYHIAGQYKDGEDEYNSESYPFL